MMVFRCLVIWVFAFPAFAQADCISLEDVVSFCGLPDHYKVRQTEDKRTIEWYDADSNMKHLAQLGRAPDMLPLTQENIRDAFSLKLINPTDLVEFKLQGQTAFSATMQDEADIGHSWRFLMIDLKDDLGFVMVAGGQPDSAIEREFELFLSSMTVKGLQ